MCDTKYYNLLWRKNKMTAFKAYHLFPFLKKLHKVRVTHVTETTFLMVTVISDQPTANGQ